MMNCTKHWYCNECLEEDMKLIQEQKRKQAQQHQHQHKSKKKYQKVPFQNKLNCNLHTCFHATSLYATQRRLQLHSLKNG